MPYNPVLQRCDQHRTSTWFHRVGMKAVGFNVHDPPTEQMMIKGESVHSIEEEMKNTSNLLRIVYSQVSVHCLCVV